MSEIVRSRNVALLVPDERIVLWEAQCAGSQAGPRAGIPTPSTSSLLALAATGAQPATSAGVEVRTLRSGFPARQSAYDATAGVVIDRGASFVWRAVGGSSTSWRGWDPPRSPSDWHCAMWTDASGNLKYGQDQVIATTPNGVVLIIAQVRETGATGGEYRLECIRRTASSDAWSRVKIEAQATAPTVDYQPAIVVLPSGRVLVYSMRQISSGVYNGVRLWYSDDSGATWSYGGDGIAGRGTSRTISRARAAYYGGQVLLLLGNGDAIEQYASADGGLTFQYIDVSDVTNPYLAFDVVAGDDGFVVGYVGGGTSSADAYARTLGNAFELFTTATESSAIAGSMTGEMALAAGDGGEIVMYTRNSSTGDVFPFFSLDGGRVWSDIVGDGNEFVRTGDTGTYLTNLAACWWRGQAIVAHNWAATPGDEDASIGVIYAGGYTTVTLPRLRSDQSISHTAGWDQMWLPFDLPSDSGWTAAGTAAVEALVTPGRLQLNTSAGNLRSYTITPDGVTNALGFGVLLDFVSVSGGDPTTNQRSILLRVGDGTDSYGVEVRIGTAAWRLYDSVATTIVGAEQTHASTTRTQILVYLAGANVSTFYRTVSSVGGVRAWTVGPTSSTLTPGAPSSDSAAWGHRATGAGAAETYFHGFFVMDGNAIGRNLATGLTNPTDLTGRMYASRGRGVYVVDEVAIAARSGPTIAGEAWTIATEYEYPRSAVTTPAPRRTWRSTAIAETQSLAFRWATIGDTPLDSGLIGIYLGAKNLGRVTIDWYDLDTTAWVNSATYDLHYDLAYAMAGESVIATASTSPIGHVARNEHTGASLEIDDVARRIGSHPDGRFSTSPPGIPLHVDDVDGAEAASGAARLVPRQALLILPITARYSGVRITQVAPDTNNPTVFQTYWEAGRVLVGPVYIVPDDPSWGRAVEWQGGTDIERSRDRTTRSRIAAPPARVVEIAWVDGTDTTGLADLAANPRHYAVHDSRSAEGSTSGALVGLLEATYAGNRQIVYIPRLTSGAAQVLQRRDEMMLCRLTSPVRIETVQGDELADEVVRVPTVTLEEDV